MFTPSNVMLPVILHSGTKSFILFKDLSTVDFPQPEGPINAVISLGGTLKLHF